MSFSSNGVTFKNTKWIQNRIYKLLFKGAEGILSVLFVISMAAPMVFPDHAYATAGVAKPLSYQGRLTDANGSPYTGTYCMRFSVWDVGTGGTANPNQLWPLAYATPYTKSITVTSGVFDTFIGSALGGDDDLSTFDFSTNDTAYLNVDVNQTPTTCGGTWDSLTPRQRLGSVAYARVAASVWGALLKTDITNSRVQVGAGTGTGAPIWLNLDWKNTPTTLGALCSTVSATNGAVWYNSSGTRALACINNIIVGVDNASEIASLNIGGNTAGTPATITSGAVTLAGGTNITLSQAGNVVTVVGPYVHNVTLGGNSTSAGAGYVQISSGTMLLAGGNNITLSQNGNSVTISGQPAHGVVIASGVGGGTAGVTASISSGYMTLAGGNNITLSQNGNAITISAGAGGGGGVAIAGGASTATNGTVIFSNANGVSFGLNNGTMTASAAGGGGAAPAIRFVEGNIRQSISNVTNITALTGRPIFIPFYVGGNLTASRIIIEMSRSTSGSNLFSIHAGFYSFANNTQLSLIGSWSNSYSNTATASVSGIRRFHITGVPAGASTLPSGNYILALEFTAAATASMNYSIRGGITAAPAVGQIVPGANSYSTATSDGMFPFFGRYSTTVAALPNSVGASQVIAGFSGASTPVGAWFGIRAD